MINFQFYLKKVLITLIFVFTMFLNSGISQTVRYDSTDIRVHPTNNSHQFEMSVAVSPVNRNVVCASAITDKPESPGIGFYFSTDGGLHWRGSDSMPNTVLYLAKPGVAIDRQENFYVNANLDPDALNDHKEYIVFYRFTKQGETWVMDLYDTIRNGGSVNPIDVDRNYLTVDNTPSSSYAGRLYCGWKEETPDSNISVKYSTNRGTTWLPGTGPTSDGIDISTGITPGYASRRPQGVNLQVGPNGYVYACWAMRKKSSPYTEYGIGFNLSTNGGTNWGTTYAPKYAIDNIQGIRNDEYDAIALPVATNSFPIMGVNMQTGKIYIVWVNEGVPGVNNGDPDIYIISSSNSGQSWSSPIRVNNDVGDAIQFNPWLSVDPINGHILISFYDNRAHVGQNLYDYYVAHSSDGGETFEDFPVNNTSFRTKEISISIPPFNDKHYGEHSGIAAMDGRCYPIWNAHLPDTNYSQ